MLTYLHVVDVTRGILLLSGRIESTRILFLDLPKRGARGGAFDTANGYRMLVTRSRAVTSYLTAPLSKCKSAHCVSNE